jgi:hypothetical protein
MIEAFTWDSLWYFAALAGYLPTYLTFMMEIPGLVAKQAKIRLHRVKKEK